METSASSWPRARAEGGAGAQQLAGAGGGEELEVVEGRGEVAGALQPGEEVGVAHLLGHALGGVVRVGRGAVGAVEEAQELDDGKVPLINGHDQGRASFLLECGLHVRPCLEADAGAVGVASQASDEERRAAIRHCGFKVGPGFEAEAGAVGVALLAGHVERRGAISHCSVHAGPGFE